jgi:hypothetical protein
LIGFPAWLRGKNDFSQPENRTNARGSVVYFVAYGRVDEAWLGSSLSRDFDISTKISTEATYILTAVRWISPSPRLSNINSNVLYPFIISFIKHV